VKFTEKAFKQLKQKKVKLPITRKEQTRRNKIRQATLEHDRIVNNLLNYLKSNGVIAFNVKYRYKIRCRKCFKFFGLVINKNLRNFPDISTLTKSGLVFIEVKTANAKLTKGQKIFRDSLPEIYKYYLIRDENIGKLILKDLI